MVDQTIDMSRVQRRVAQAFFGDGLFELLTGLMFICMGAMAALPEGTSLLYLPWVLLTVVFPIVRKRHVMPRAGYVGLPGDRSRIRLTIGLAVMCLLGLAVLLLGVGDRQSPVARATLGIVEWLIEHAPLVAGLGFAAFFAYVGWRTQFRRLWIYATGSLLCAIAFSLLRLRLGLRTMGLLVTIGTLMTIWGLLLFTAFLRDNPIRPEGGSGSEPPK